MFADAKKTNPTCQPIDLGEELRDAAIDGNIIKTFALLALNDTLNPNEPDKISGRTALHLAYNFTTSVRHEEVVSILKAFGAKDNLKDKNRCTPFDLFLNPHEYEETDTEIDWRTYFLPFEYCISIYNYILKSKKLRYEIIFANTSEEVDEFITKNPTKNRLGFLVRLPACSQDHAEDTLDTHVIPIVYERRGEYEFFIQFDSLGKNVILFPESDKGFKRKIFISTIKRQAEDAGCIADAILLLFHLAFFKIGKYVVTNFDAKKYSFKGLTFNELELLNRYKDPEEKLSRVEMEDGRALFLRNQILKQTAWFDYFSIKYVKDIYKIKNLPMILFSHIERFDVMHSYRTLPKAVEAFSRPYDFKPSISLIDHLLATGKKREQKHSDEKIKANFSNPSKEFDFAGRSFENRHNSFIQYFGEHCLYFCGFFKSKIIALEKLQKKPETSKADQPYQLILRFLMG